MKKILIIKVGAIGDVITTLPVVTEIKKKHPASHITWVCGRVVFEILKCVPDIDNLLVIDESKIFNKNKWIALKAIFAFQKNVAFKNYDVILNFHNDSRYKVLSALAKTQVRLHLTREGERPTLLPGRSRSSEHIRLFLQTDDNNDAAVSFPPDTIKSKSPANSFFNNVDGVKTVILCPGGAKNILNDQILRRWPIESYVKTAQYLLDNGFRVVITGAQSDIWVVPYFDTLDVKNLVGSLSLVELVSLMRTSDCVITHDSGPFHLAVFASNPQIIGLFGPTSPDEVSYGKGYDNIHVLWEGKSLQCCPCYYGKYFSKECKENICMQLNEVEKVIDIIENVIK